MLTGLNRFHRVALSAVCLLAGLAGPACETLPTIDGIPIDDLANTMCEGPASGDLSWIVARPNPPQVVIRMIRGFGDISSRGLDRLAAELAAIGLDASAVGLEALPALREQLITQYHTSADPPTIVMGGHSYGGDEAVKMAMSLRDRGVPVGLLLLVDATDPPAIPDNVDRCVHFYVPWFLGDAAPNVMPGNPVVPAEGNTHTEIVNDAIGYDSKNESEWCINHLGVDSSGYVRRKILYEIYALPE